LIYMYECYINEKTNNNLLKNFLKKTKIQNINGEPLISYKKSVGEKIGIKRVIKFLEKNYIENVVLSKNLYNNNKLINELFSNNINIIQGNLLPTIFLEECIEKIYGKNKIFYEIAFLINDYDERNINNIKKFIGKTRKITIVTNHKEYFKNLAIYCFEQYGLILKITNNKTNSLLKANLIINIDFPNEIINQYKIGAEAVIFNLKTKTEIIAKSYQGINIVDYDFEIPAYLKIEEFNDKDIYESLILKKQLCEVETFIKNNKIKVKNIIGKNGVINDKEIARFT